MYGCPGSQWFDRSQLAVPSARPASAAKTNVLESALELVELLF